MSKGLQLKLTSVNGWVACPDCEEGYKIGEEIPRKCGACGKQLWAVLNGKVQVRTITSYSRKTPVKDRYGNLWFLEMTSGAWGQLSVQVTRSFRGYKPSRGDSFMPLGVFLEWARKRRIRGLGYEELFGPNASVYGRSQYYGRTN